MKKKVMDCFSQGAKTYNVVAHLQKKVADNLIQRLPASEPHHILEIGCGTGLLSQSIHHLFPDAKILLTDISAEMIQQCRTHFSNKNNVEWYCVDGEDFHLNSTKQFNLILSSMTFHWFSHIQKSLISLSNALFPRGRILFSMLGEKSLSEWKAVCQQFNLEVGTPIFPQREKLLQSLPDWKFDSEIILKTYQHGYDFVKQLKQLGAHATHANYAGLSAGKLRKLLRHLHQPLAITYEIIYGSYIKT